MDVSKMSKEEYEEYLDEIDLDDEEDELEEDEIDEGGKTFEQAKEFYQRDNGNRFLNPAKIFGTIAGVVAVVAHIVHTFVSNVLFGKYEQLAIREAFMRGLGSPGEKGEVSSNGEKEGKEEKQEVEKRDNKEHEKSTEQIAIKRANIPNDITKEEAYANKEDIVTLKNTFENPSVQHVFALNGYLVDAIQDKNKAFLFEYKDGKVNGVARGFQAGEFYTQNFNGMAQAIQEIDNISNTEAAFKSCALYAGIITQFNEEEKEYFIGKEIAAADIKTPYGSDTVSFVWNKKNDKEIDVLYNKEKIAKIDVEQIQKEPFNNYKKDLLDAIKIKNHKLKLDNDLSVSWNNKSNKLTIYYKDSFLGKYSFQSENDIQLLSKKLKENNIVILDKQDNEYISIQPDSLAYTLAILTNPDLEFKPNKNNMYVNPITHAEEENGKSHIYTSHSKDGVRIHAFVSNQDDMNEKFELCSFSSRNSLTAESVRKIAACMQETSYTLEKISDIDTSYKRDLVKTTDEPALKPDKKDLSSDLFHGLYEKCRNEIGFGDTVIPTTIPLDHVMDELKSVFGVEYETETEESKIPEDLDSKKLNSEKAIDIEKNNEIPTGFDENEIENDSWFVPAYDEER